MDESEVNTRTHEHREYGFAIGLLAGTCVGAGLVMWLAPRSASELRQRMTEPMVGLGRTTSERCQEVGTRVSTAVDEIGRRGQEAVDAAADTVARGAHEVGRRVTALKSGHVNEARSGGAL